MASTFLVVGDANSEFSTDGVGYTGIGVIVSAENEFTSDKLEIKDRGGNVQTVVYFNQRNQCTIDCIFKTGATLPIIGDALSVCGLTYVHVDSLTHKWTNDKERMLTIKATKYAAFSA